ncbi:MAG: hypothetical protein SX243_09910 [Acidobacteriota bacterium]|nr:hypothetical protein [Acidobacteriota bacterium]
MKLRFLLPLALLLLASTGCVTLDMLLQVQPDGSGRLNTEIRIQNAFLQLAEGMVGAGGSTSGDAGIFSEANLLKMAKGLGPGAELISHEPVEDPYTSGVKAVFAIPDVRAMSFDAVPVAPNRNTQGTVDLEQGDGRTTLLLTFPAPEEASGKPLLQGADVEGMKDLLTGLKINLAVQVPGKILETNSPFASGDQVTVAALDLDQLLADPEGIATLTSASASTIAQVGELLNGFAGVRFHPEEELRVVYQTPKGAKLKPAPKAPSTAQEPPAPEAPKKPMASEKPAQETEGGEG